MAHILKNDEKKFFCFDNLLPPTTKGEKSSKSNRKFTELLIVGKA